MPNMAMGAVQRRPLAPAPPRPPPIYRPRVTFFDLPAELRIEIYKLSLEDVSINIALPDAVGLHLGRPHALARTSRQVRNEVLPMIHAMCPIRVNVHNFNFEGLLLWMSRIPPDQEVNLCKNNNLNITITTTETPRSLESLRKWLHMRADPYRPQPRWKYSGLQPGSKICADLRRRVKRMKEPGKQEEMLVMLRSLNVPLGDDLSHQDRRGRGS